jgi:hypothetical protein
MSGGTLRSLKKSSTALRQSPLKKRRGNPAPLKRILSKSGPPQRSTSDFGPDEKCPNLSWARKKSPNLCVPNRGGHDCSQRPEEAAAEASAARHRGSQPPMSSGRPHRVRHRGASPLGAVNIGGPGPSGQAPSGFATQRFRLSAGLAVDPGPSRPARRSALSMPPAFGGDPQRSPTPRCPFGNPARPFRLCSWQFSDSIRGGPGRWSLHLPFPPRSQAFRHICTDWQFPPPTAAPSPASRRP